MDNLSAKNRHMYYSSLWENGKLKSKQDALTRWNERAISWASLLSSESAFKRSLDDRVKKASDFLLKRGLLRRDIAVADIGCGTGRFAVEFAKTAAHVTAIDISGNMLELTRRYADESGINNLTCTLCDFSEANIDKEKWIGAFDLVFTSITGAIGGISNLEKAMRMSRAYCFNSSFIHTSDELEKRIAKDVFGIETQTAPNTEGNLFYALFNLLWLKGYYPETFYHKQLHDNIVPADDELADYYARAILRDTGLQRDGKLRIKEYFSINADDDGNIRQYAERWYGWILWDVRDVDNNRGKEVSP